MKLNLKLLLGVLLVVTASLIATCTLAISTEPIPTNPCIDCTCPYVQNDQNYTTELVFPNIRGYRYMELFLTCPGAGTGIYNTMGFNIQADNSKDSAPANLMANYSDEQAKNEYKADGAYMSGIRYWMQDKIRITIANNVRNFAGLDTRWGANAAISADALTKGEQYYGVTNVTCNRTWYFDEESQSTFWMRRTV